MSYLDFKTSILAVSELLIVQKIGLWTLEPLIIGIDTPVHIGMHSNCRTFFRRLVGKLWLQNVNIRLPNIVWDMQMCPYLVTYNSSRLTTYVAHGI